jgi:hypothetical protein
VTCGAIPVWEARASRVLASASSRSRTFSTTTRVSWRYTRKDCCGGTPQPARERHDLMTWVTLFPLRSAAVRPCTPRHFCFSQTPFFPLKLRGLAKSKLPPSRAKNGGHVLLESVTHVMRLSQTRALPGSRANALLVIKFLCNLLAACPNEFCSASCALPSRLPRFSRYSGGLE